MINTVTIQGRLTYDPEERVTQQGPKVSRFALACQTSETVTDFINCIAWGKTADTVNRYLHKGDMAVVSGSLHISRFEDRDGNRREKAEITVNNIGFMLGARYQTEPKEEELADDEPGADGHEYYVTTEETVLPF